jgi:protein SCO1/2
MDIVALRKFRLFVWGCFIVMLCSVATLYALRGIISSKAILAKGEEVPALSASPDFSLPAHSGETVSNKSLAGKVWVADFFFSRCQGVCPKMKADLKVVQDAFDKDERVKLVSFTVDPQRDTLEALRTYAKKWGANAGQWFFLRGEHAAVGRLASKGFLLAGTEVPGEILHSSKFVLVDKGGLIRGYYDGTDKGDVDRLIADIRRLLQAP